MNLATRTSIMAFLASTALAIAACGGSSGGGVSSSSSSTSSSEPPDPEISGLDQRPTNTTCLAGEAPAPNTSVELEPVFSQLGFNQPVGLLQAPGDNSHWYLLEQGGRILMFDNSDGASSSEFADLRARVDTSSNANESGLLAMAFHPNYAQNRQVFLFYQISKDTTAPITDDCCVSQLVRYQANEAGTALDPDSAEVLLSFEPPYENHFGGDLGFDDQGYLYLSIGDGGAGGDPGNRAQNTANIFGAMLRLNVDAGSPYSIPADNPFADQSGFLCNTDQQMDAKEAANGDCPELYAWGLRNPWRWSFDRATGDLWLADVGQGEWEEVNLIERGGNYGWRIREGAHCYNPSEGCPTAGLIDPVGEVPQPDFQSITGGYRYRGSDIASLVGKYVFGDFVTGRLYSLVDDGEGGWEVDPLIINTGHNIASFAEDQNGELYLLGYGGSINRLVAGEADGTLVNPPAQQLSDTGCVNPDAPWEAAEGLIPYDLNAPFWSDGADKERWLALPDNASIGIADDQDWDLPPGSVLVKNFYLNQELIESRLFKHHSDGNWAGYSYAWDEEGLDAQLVQGGQVVERQGQDWIYPSGSECLQCHTQAAGRTLGLETAQLNRDHSYPTTGRTANQIDTLLAIGVLEGEPEDLSLADPYADLPADQVPDQARAYLHTNCAQCHRPEGPTNVNMDLRAVTSLPDMNICNVQAQGDSGSMRLVPGDAEASVLVERMTLRDHALQMPPIGSALVDDEGEALLREWINNLPSSACE